MPMQLEKQILFCKDFEENLNIQFLSEIELQPKVLLVFYYSMSSATNEDTSYHIKNWGLNTNNCLVLGIYKVNPLY